MSGSIRACCVVSVLLLAWMCSLARGGVSVHVNWESTQALTRKLGTMRLCPQDVRLILATCSTGTMVWNTRTGSVTGFPFANELNWIGTNVYGFKIRHDIESTTETKAVFVLDSHDMSDVTDQYSAATLSQLLSKATPRIRMRYDYDPQTKRRPAWILKQDETTISLRSPLRTVRSIREGERRSIIEWWDEAVLYDESTDQATSLPMNLNCGGEVFQLHNWFLASETILIAQGDEYTETREGPVPIKTVLAAYDSVAGVVNCIEARELTEEPFDIKDVTSTGILVRKHDDHAVRLIIVDLVM